MIRLDHAVRVTDSSEVASARRAAVVQAEAMQLGDTIASKAALVVTELATNILKHGQGGTILVGSEEDGAHRAVVLLGLDKGRGIPNVATAMQDGYSTAGSPGTGLGAIARITRALDIFTLVDRGTAVLCRVFADAPGPMSFDAPTRATVAGVCIPKTGETIAGDGWVGSSSRDVVTIAVSDGLGHGPLAANASREAGRVFSSKPEDELANLLSEAHGALRPTRGAAVGIARIHLRHSRVDFAGVGNIAGTIVADDNVRRVVSLNGIVGHEMRKVQTFSYPWSASSVLVLHSDGISSGWNPANYPGLMQHDPALIAGVIYRDACRGTDDATVVVAKAS